MGAIDAEVNTSLDSAVNTKVSSNLENGPFGSIQVEISVVVGKSRPTINTLVNLKESSVLILDAEISDPVQVYVGDKLIAMGELQDSSIEDKSILSVKITDLLSK